MKMWPVKMILLSMSVAMYGKIQAQTFSEWFQQKKTQIAYYTEQVAALKAYSELLVKGYTIVRDGLQVVSDIKNGDFNLHNNYFASLNEINDAFHTDAASIYENILRQCKNAETLATQFPTGQQKYIVSVAVHLREKATEHLRQYERLTTADHYELKDAERLARIDQCLNAMSGQYGFAKKCCHQLQVMLLRQTRENEDTKRMQQMYNR